jgi:D-alanyl-D-alanine carboxypeptidase
MTPLSQLQQQFVLMVAELIKWAAQHECGLTFGEAFRTPQQAEWDAKAGTGIARSLHCDRLAVDFNLFRNGSYVTDTADYEPLGVYWESLGGSWGGRFAKPDGNHFSLAYEGRR